MNNNTTISTKVKTGEVRLSYAHIFEPNSIDGGEAKYSVSIIIPKSDTITLNNVKRAIDEAVRQGVGKFGGKIPGVLKTPLRDGDVERGDDETYKNSYFINASSKTKPGVLNEVGQQAVPAEVYSGCYARVSVNFYAFNSAGNKGVACGLNNLMKTRDGESLGGRLSATDDFAEELQAMGSVTNLATVSEFPWE